MYRRLGNMILLVWCLSISIITTCDAQDFESREFMKSSSNNETLRKQQESIEELMKQVGDMGMLLENYRRVIVNGITESNDICGFIENLSYPEDKSDKSIEKTLSNNDMGVNLYKQFFRNINDALLKTQLFATLENNIDNCYNLDIRRILVKPSEKRDKSQLQKIRFHSWGGKRNRGSPKVVIRTPFHSWGGKRSDDSI